MNREQALIKFHARDFSVSQMNSFLYDPKQWYDSYILNKKQDSEELRFGSHIGKKLELEPDYFPEIPRYGKDEYPFKIVLEGITIVGYADSFNPITCKQLGERKTGKTKWTQKRVDESIQLTMYCLLNYVQNNINPKDVEITLSWMPTKLVEDANFNRTISFNGEIKTFTTQRTLMDVLNFANQIKKTYKKMEDYITIHG